MEQTSENKQMSEGEMHTKLVRSWLEGMRDYGYSYFANNPFRYALLGCFTHTENFFSIDQLPSAIVSFVFGNYTDFIEYRHLKILLSMYLVSIANLKDTL